MCLCGAYLPDPHQEAKTEVYWAPISRTRTLRLSKAPQFTHSYTEGKLEPDLPHSILHSPTLTELRKILSPNKYLLKAYWVPETARGTGALAMDRTVPVLWELAFHVRRVALNTQYKMNMELQWGTQV